MDDQQNLDSQSLKDRPWTTDEIRKHSSNWTLAGDVGLFNLLNEFSHNIISRTHEVENAVDSLVHQTKMTSAKINNIINDFHMLSNLQFVENRVYDEEIQEPVPETKSVAEKTKEQKEAEMLPKIMKAIELGLAVLDTAFDRINVNEISDSEDEEDISSEGRTILEPKDPYEQRPLPYIIGSAEFMKCDYAGLKELVEEEVQSFSEESSISVTDETSSDEGEQLPLDDEDDKFSGKQTDQLSQNISDRISSSDESELFGSEKDVNGFISDSSLDLKTKEKNIQRKPSISTQPEKEVRQNSVSSLQSKLKLPQVLPVPKLQEKKKDDDLFANEEENSEDESPFRKKTGLFSSDVRFDEDEKDGDLFGGNLFGKSPSKEDKEAKPTKPSVEVAKVPPKQPQTTLKSEVKEPTLFDNDEDSEDDIFNTLMKTKKPNLAKTSNPSSQESSEKADTASTPSSAPSIKSSGNTFDFGGGNGDLLFGDDSDGEDLFSNKKSSQRKKFDFDAAESDDLFGITSKPLKETKVVPETKSSLFEVSKATDPQPKGLAQKSALTKKTKDSIFEDSDSSDQEKIVQVKSPISAPVKTKPKSLFDDDDFENDIFTQQTVKKNADTSKLKKEGNLSLFDNEPKQDKSTKTKPVKEAVTKPSLFSDDSEKEESIKSNPVKKETLIKQNVFAGNSDKVENAKTKPVKKEVPTKSSLFEDDSEKDESTKSESVKKELIKPNLFADDLETESPKSVPKTVQPKQLSLFEDSDNFDLFAPKPSVKKAEPPMPAQVPKSALDSTKAIDDTDGSVTSKIPSPSKDINVDSQISFDAPVDSSNVLNVINKGRAKITTKRRKPTRQGRLAALESSEKEIKPDTTISDTSAVDDSFDNLFSTSITNPKVEVGAPKLDYKAQEKKKMNLMSQLISEAAISKVVLKKPVETEKVEEEEEEVDIFSETVKGRSKSSFSFLPPQQNGIASMFPVEKKEDKEETLDVSKLDSSDDDFFTEPSFQNFRSSISHKDSILDLEDDDDDDDLFSTKTSSLPKAKPDSSDPNDLFDDDTDIFADVQKEKYEMFPNQIYEDEDDDIFGNISNTISNKPLSSSKTNNSSSVKKVETQQVNAFDDPLTGLLGED